MSENIVVKGARLNNLKNLNIEIPRGKLVVITGISGSGKSTLAFDTIFAEGQRRFVESLSSFARQFLGRVSKPDADEISGIPPAIAIEQRVNTRNPRSTVGSTTEIYEYLRLLFARIGETYSPLSGERVTKDSVGDIVHFIESQQQNSRVYILVPLRWINRDNITERLLSIREAGYTRVWRDGEIETIEDLLSGKVALLDDHYLLIDRTIISAQEEIKERMFDSIGSALSVMESFEESAGKITIAVDVGEGPLLHNFSTLFEKDGILFEEPSPSLFSYNNPIGACPTCSGYGKTMGIDESLVIPDPTLSVYEEAVACWRGEVMNHFYKELIETSHKFNFPIHKPYKELSEPEKTLLWSGNEYFTGINRFFQWVEENKYKIQYRYMLSRYSGKTTCPQCKGRRLRKEALYILVGGKDISALMEMSIEELSLFFNNLSLTPYQEEVASRILKEIKERLSCMVDVGLPYLTLERPSRSLSGGESQRINIVSSIGSSLVGSLYILDEPSIGLHPRDTSKLIKVLYKLRDLGNTLLVVEHDQEIMRAADLIIDIGPFAGSYGGEVVFVGTPDDAQQANPGSRSLTVDYLNGTRKIELPQISRRAAGFIEIVGASQNNLKGIDVKFPLKLFTAVTGVSGSGKSTLVKEILYPALNRAINQLGEKPGLHKELRGDLTKITSIEYVDQNPIGRSSRSNPATYLKVYDEIRKLFSEQPYAKANKFGHSHFSFNIDGGRCPECEGDGSIKIEMQFMADVKMVCDSCGGKRFKDEILEVKYKGLNINDVLNLRVDEAIEFFSSQKEPIAKRIAEKLSPLKAVGLSYVQLGQSSSTLSGGESQRVKLAHFLAKESSNDSILFIFDEPTTGLHFHDINKLMDSFNALIERGHTIIVVEHNMDVVKCADWIIDLGPEGGAKGGELLFCGRPRDLVKSGVGYTAKALAPYFT